MTVAIRTCRDGRVERIFGGRYPTAPSAGA